MSVMTTAGRLCLPYCLHKVGKNEYVILNRRYQFLGSAPSDRAGNDASYKDSRMYIKLRISRITAARLSCTGSEDVEMIWLFNDGCNPHGLDWKIHRPAYFQRLSVLMNLGSALYE